MSRDGTIALQPRQQSETLSKEKEKTKGDKLTVMAIKVDEKSIGKKSLRYPRHLKLGHSLLITLNFYRQTGAPVLGGLDYGELYLKT